MWLFTPFGYFSIVEKPQDRGDGMLTVRARFAGDLEALRTRHLPTLGAVRYDPTHNDYAYRARAPKADVAQAIAATVAAIDYENFKDEVSHVQGHARSDIYLQVWSVLKRAQDALTSIVRQSGS